jgi:hypothetical protein
MKKITEDDLDLNGEDDFTQDKKDFVIGEDMDTEPEYAEVEVTAAEPTKLTDIDGSVLIVVPGDIVTVKSESLKRINKTVESK